MLEAPCFAATTSSAEESRCRTVHDRRPRVSTKPITSTGFHVTKTILVLFATTLFTACTATAPRPDKACFHLNEASETRIGYCQAIASGDRLYISGSVGKGPMPDAIRMAYAELEQTLKAQGLTFRDVIKENVYATDLDAFIESQDVRKAYYAGDFPAATWVQVQRLYRPAYVVEIELTARMR